MKSIVFAAGVLLALMPCSLRVFAAPSQAAHNQTALKELPPQAYQMSLVWMADAATPREFIFVINGAVGYKTVTALENSISHFPPGSTLTWAPSDTRRGGEPLLSSPQDMKEFVAFCAKEKVKLVIIPGG